MRRAEGIRRGVRDRESGIETLYVRDERKEQTCLGRRVSAVSAQLLKEALGVLLVVHRRLQVLNVLEDLLLKLRDSAGWRGCWWGCRGGAHCYRGGHTHQGEPYQDRSFSRLHRILLLQVVSSAARAFLGVSRYRNDLRPCGGARAWAQGTVMSANCQAIGVPNHSACTMPTCQ